MARWTKPELLENIKTSCQILKIPYSAKWQNLPYNDLTQLNNRLTSQIRHNNGDILGI